MKRGGKLMNQKTMGTKEGKFANYPQQPHGGKLVDQVLTGKELDDELIRAEQLPMIMIDMEAVITVEMIATGVLSPNEGFMDEVNYKSVLSKGRLDNGLVWPVPLSFAPTGERNRVVVEALAVGDDVTLADENKDRSEEHTSELQSRGQIVC